MKLDKVRPSSNVKRVIDWEALKPEEDNLVETNETIKKRFNRLINSPLKPSPKNPT